MFVVASFFEGSAARRTEGQARLRLVVLPLHSAEYPSRGLFAW